MLLNDRKLEQSSIVANRLMNRERGAWGPNSYAKELGFNSNDKPDAFPSQRRAFLSPPADHP